MLICAGLKLGRQAMASGSRFEKRKQQPVDFLFTLILGADEISTKVEPGKSRSHYHLIIWGLSLEYVLFPSPRSFGRYIMQQRLASAINGVPFIISGFVSQSLVASCLGAFQRLFPLSGNLFPAWQPQQPGRV